MKEFKVEDVVTINGTHDGVCFEKEIGIVKALHPRRSDFIGVELNRRHMYFHSINGVAKQDQGFWVYPSMCSCKTRTKETLKKQLIL